VRLLLRVRTVVLLTVTALGLSFGLAASASAGTTPNMPACSTASGNLIDQYGVAGGYAKLYLYYDAARGTNCAKMVHQGAAYGRAARTMVQLWTCTTRQAGKECFRLSSDAPYYGRDAGNYSYYAGPVSVRAANRCIYARA